ncbi:hypothetical protein OPIT5_12070 [Opitutaceae bacterium TAV5]|nr:hypothetical protein OPIT5_12070 [Opitutaceae bacterium TAV5]
MTRLPCRNSLRTCTLLCTLLFTLFAGKTPAQTDSPLPKLSKQNTLVLEPEKFVSLGAWQKEGGFIRATGKRGSVAFTGFNVPESGDYHVWTLAPDFPKNGPATRRFLLKIDGVGGRESGQHRQEGWRWEKVLTLRLEAGDHLAEIEDAGLNWARCDAVILTSTALDPNSRAAKGGNTAFRSRFIARLVQPERIYEGAHAAEALPPPPADAGRDLAAPLYLKNGDITLVFRTVRAADGSPRIWREISLPGNAGKMTAGLEPLFVLHSEKNPRRTLLADDYFAMWKPAVTTRWRIGARVIEPEGDPKDPWTAGVLRRLAPVSVRRVSERAVALVYRETNPVPAAVAGSKTLARPLEATLTWTLPEHGHATRLDAVFTAPETAWYSLAFAAGPSPGPAEISAVQLPPLFQFHRLPEAPMMLMSVETPHPLAVVESRVGTKKTADETAVLVTHGVVAARDATLIPENNAAGGGSAGSPGPSPKWFGRDNSACGFSLTAPDGGTQPVLFTPIMGFEDSQVAKSASLRRSWWVITAPGPWASAMREADLSIFANRDYREPVSVSLTEQAFNLMDLLGDETAAGWDARLKGPLNIESVKTATHAAPLAYLSAANLTRDEDFYARRVLPTVEFLLTRPSTHFGLKNTSYVRENEAGLDFERRPYSSAVWQGVDVLLGEGANPWLARDYAFPGGDIRKVTRSPSRAPEWSDLLALYRHAPTPELLAKIRADADAWIARRFSAAAETRPVGAGPFYNAGNFYPPWWDLPDLYELTRDQRYLDAAMRGAELTIAGLWTHPSPPSPAELVRIHPGGKIANNYHVWFLPDGTVGRLGFPKKPGAKLGDWQSAVLSIPEKTVPAWTVSPVGLGLEQPITFVRNAGASGSYHNILLSVWAANLLRVAAYSNDDYIRAFARNTLIGRGGSYPGYYIADYSDLLQNPAYPRTGPEINTFYWHHIPVHLAMVLDYLFTDAEMRTGGAVSFPYAKQQGYAWFSARIYGGKPGRVFDDTNCRPWLDKTRQRFRVETRMVDYIGARSRDKFHLVLLNQSRSAVSAPVFVAAGEFGRSARLRTAETDMKQAFNADGRATISLPKNGWAVLTFDAAPDTGRFASPPRPLPDSAAPQTHPLPDPWGQLRAFRIRSPFGKDALYFAFSGKIPPGSKAELLLGGNTAAAVDRAPYELSVYPYDQDETAAFRIRLTTADGRQNTTQTFKLPAR